MPLPKPEDQPLLTTREAAEHLGTNQNAIYNRIRQGEIPCIRFGGRIFIPTAELRRILLIDVEPPVTGAHDDSARSRRRRSR